MPEWSISPRHRSWFPAVTRDQIDRSHSAAEIAPGQLAWAREYAWEGRNRARSACLGAGIRLGRPKSRPVPEPTAVGGLLQRPPARAPNKVIAATDATLNGTRNQRGEGPPNR